MRGHPLPGLVRDQLRRTFGRPGYWHTEAAPGSHVDYERPRGYYFDYSRRADYDGPARDGVPVIELSNGKMTTNPPDVAQFALGNLELYLTTGNDRRKRLFDAAVSVLMSDVEVVPGGFAGWPMPTAPRAYVERLGSGWFSAMSHGECMSVLVRADTLFGTEGALALARRAMGGFETHVDHGGMLREVGDPGHDGGLASKIFLEEYPMSDRPSMVLNGHVHAMWGVYDLAAATADPAARALFERCADALEFVLERYDTGWWSRYDLDERWNGYNPASLLYHRIHIRQLRTLHRMTGRDSFAETADRWEFYERSRWNATRAFWRKVQFKLRNPDSVLARMPGMS